MPGRISFSTRRSACVYRRSALSRRSGVYISGNGRGWGPACLGNETLSVVPRPCRFVCASHGVSPGIGRGFPVVCDWYCGHRHVGFRVRGVGRDGTDGGSSPTVPPSMMLFSDFIASKSNASPPATKKKVSDEEMDALIERTSGVLQDAVEALQQVRAREARGAGMGAGPATGTSKKTNKNVHVGRPKFLSGGMGGRTDEMGSTVADSSFSPTNDSFKGQPSGSPGAADSMPSSTSPSSSSSSSRSIDGWFRGKVDAGPLIARQQSAPKASASASPGQLKFKEKDDMPSVLEFTAQLEAPEASAAAMSEVFPEHLALRFQSEVFSDIDGAEEASSAAFGSNAFGDAVSEGSTTVSATNSGEEFGPNGYWYRWTEVSGQNEAGTVVWTERWWEVSDWSGMKELGAEKYGMNEHGDVWRETWTEKIVIEGKNKKPMVLRSAHKWARAAGGREWEEKWEEKYWSGGKTQKWAEKWGQEGSDVWHEKWGEDYDGQGTDRCVKWTDRWAESDGNKWGDKWREEFQGGMGEKTGETWSEAVGQDKYQRWWGEKHMGDGRVQKFGNSTTGETWDVVEEMDTYYNPIPHFGYDLALSHSPQLHNVPTLPIDEEIIF